MSAIRELFPRPNISINEKAMNLIIYGFDCEIYEKDEYIPCRAFVDPDAFSMFNICTKKDGELYRRINFFEILNVGCRS